MRLRPLAAGLPSVSACRRKNPAFFHSLAKPSHHQAGNTHDVYMTHFSVDSEQVLAANANIQSTITRLSAEADSLLAQLQALQGSWTGVASNSFQELVIRWRATATTVDAQLSELGTALGIAAAQYAEIEFANQRLFL